MRRILRRILALLACMLPVCGASAESFAFTLQAEAATGWHTSASREKLAGFSTLLDELTIEGTYASHEGSFELDAALILGSGRTRSSTEFRLYGTDSHWGLTSSLLGPEELMINVAALLPFGMKTRSYVDVPLDQAALLAPYTHTHALRAPEQVLAPLFPEHNGAAWLPRAAVDELARDFLRICDEDAAFSAWLEATGTYQTAVGIANYILNMPQAVYGLSVIRTDDRLTWEALGLVTIMTLEQSGSEHSLQFTIPSVASIEGHWRDEDGFTSGQLTARLYGLDADFAFELPNAYPITRPDFFASADIRSPVFPSGSFTMRLEGSVQGDAVTASVFRNSNQPLLTLKAEMSPWEPDALPAWQPEDLTGMNILSATGDSLGVLIRDAQEPLLTGLYDLLVAAPPEAVQSLMDALEDLGVIDLMVDSLLGEPAY